jgi:hypothetical protein
MLFSVILLIGAGFGFIKHALSKNERMVFLIVIPLQVPPYHALLFSFCYSALGCLHLQLVLSHRTIAKLGT